MSNIPGSVGNNIFNSVSKYSLGGGIAGARNYGSSSHGGGIGSALSK